MISQVTSREVVHDQVNILSVLECVIHVHDERVIQLCEDLPFIHDTLKTALSQYSGLGHLLHSILLLCLFAFYLPNLAKTSLADAILVVKSTLTQSYRWKRINT
jgi:hypothetical protein